MSSKTRNSLKVEFVAGTAATQTKFEDLIDSAYNTTEDSLLYGPLGMTGFSGLWIGLTAPFGSTAPGLTGQMYLPSGATSDIYLNNGTNWIKFAGSTAW